MKNSSSFFANMDCEFFPCHKVKNEKDFNCMFCYCPLYALGDRCGGNPVFTKDGTKDCSGCVVPHSADAADIIMKKWPDIAALISDKK